MGSAPSDIRDRSEEAASPARRTIVLPSAARPVLLVLNFLAQIVPLWLMHQLGQGWPVFIMAGILLGLVPAIDHVLGQGGYHFDSRLSHNTKQGLLFAQAVFLLLTFAAAVAVASSGRVPLWASIFAVVTVGIINVHIPVVAHDFGHKMDRTNRMISNAICAIGGLGYFMPQHTMGHHIHVATPEDCASARFGQSSYAFIFGAFLPDLPVADFCLSQHDVRLRARVRKGKTYQCGAGPASDASSARRRKVPGAVSGGGVCGWAQVMARTSMLGWKFTVAPSTI